MKRVAFRVASAPEVGGGHIFRCLAIADAVKAMGNTVLFFVDSIADELVGRIRLAGYKVGEDNAELRQNIMKKWDTIVIDSYQLSQKDLQFWCSKGQNSLVFDDYDNGCNFCTTRIVAKPYLSTNHNNGRILFGPDFIPLGANFRKHASVRFGPVKKVLFMFGLRDSVGATLLALEVWQEILNQLPTIELSCVIGSTCPSLKEIKKSVEGIGGRILIDHKNISQLLVEFDMAVGGGGLSLYERACSGLVNIATPIADNQKPLCHWLASNGGCLYVEFDPVSFKQKLRESILNLIFNQNTRVEISKNAMALIDGRGAERVATRIVS